MEGDTYSFVVRIWHEAVDETGSITAWRGSIEQVGDDRRVYFMHLGEIISYIERQVGLKHANSPLDESETHRSLA
jgi:hypothetical protein